MFSRRKVAALAAEFLGTGVLAFVIVTLSRSQLGYPYFLAIGAGIIFIMLGLSLARDVQLNPAYTIGLWTARRIGTMKAIAFILAQMAGAACAYLLYKYFTQTGQVQALPDEYRETVLVAEALGAFIFSFLAANAFRHTNQTIRVVSAGLAYAVGVMAASVAGIGFINPAVAMASNAWNLSTFVLGPVLGAIAGVNLYSLLFAERDHVSAVRAAGNGGSGRGGALARRLAARRKLNKDAIEVSPANVAEKPLAKVEKAVEKAAEKVERTEKSESVDRPARHEKSGKSKNKKSKK